MLWVIAGAAILYYGKPVVEIESLQQSREDDPSRRDSSQQERVDTPGTQQHIEVRSDECADAMPHNDWLIADFLSATCGFSSIWRILGQPRIGGGPVRPQPATVARPGALQPVAADTSLYNANRRKPHSRSQATAARDCARGCGGREQYSPSRTQARKNLVEAAGVEPASGKARPEENYVRFRSGYCRPPPVGPAGRQRLSPVVVSLTLRAEALWPNPAKMTPLGKPTGELSGAAT